MQGAGTRRCVGAVKESKQVDRRPPPKPDSLRLVKTRAARNWTDALRRSKMILPAFSSNACHQIGKIPSTYGFKLA